jgi:predicted ABC-type sugar transport system permease subunit
MALGFGVFLIVIGAVLIWALDVDLSFVDDNTLGWILIIAGVLAIALSLIVNQQRNRHTTTHIDERRYET